MRAKGNERPALELHSVGCDFRHEAGFLINRPRGSGDYLFVHATTAVLIKDADGRRVMPPHTCILYAPGFPQWYRADGESFANDWTHFGGAGVKRLVRRCGIAVNRSVQPLYYEQLASLLRGVAREYGRREPHWQEACSALLQQLLVAFARGCAAGGNAGNAQEAAELRTPRMVELASAFSDLRSEVHGQLAHPWTVQEMARRAHLSPSRFARLYHLFFRVSPVDDLIAARVAHACWLLSTGTVLIKQVASDAGFTDCHYFSRCFRVRIGCAPSDYRDRFLGLPRQT
jgi:AraC family transcriptional regulator of arabinose operon